MASIPLGLMRLILLVVLFIANGVSVAVGRPNVVVIVSDDAGYADFSMHGSKTFLTPRIDSIATSGVRFTQGYVTAPVCSPSRAGILTGRYQTRFGHELNIQIDDSPVQGMPVEQKTFADVMKGAGYRTIAVGKWHVGQAPHFRPQARGFDDYYGFLGGARTYFPGKKESVGFPVRKDDEPIEESFGYLTDDLAQRAAGYIRENKDRPFFMYLAFNAVHSPYDASPEDLKNVHGVGKDREKLCAMTLGLDRGVGVVLDELKAQGLTDNTIVFFINDNGGATGYDNGKANATDNSPLRGTKGTGFEGGIRVPFAVQWPAQIPKGQVFNAPVISLDIMATTLAAAQVSPPRDLDGVSLLPYIDHATSPRPVSPPHESLFWRWGAVKVARVGDWKMLQAWNQPLMLFNLATDPAEQNNLAEQQPEKLQELEAAYARWDKLNVPMKWTYDKKP